MWGIGDLEWLSGVKLAARWAEVRWGLVRRAELCPAGPATPPMPSHMLVRVALPEAIARVGHMGKVRERGQRTLADVA